MVKCIGSNAVATHQKEVVAVMSHRNAYPVPGDRIVRFDALIHPETARKVRFVKASCRLPNYTETFRQAVSLFEFCLNQYVGTPPRAVFFLHKISRAEKLFWPYVRGQEKPLDDVSVLSKYSCNINVATQQAVDTIKEVYELDSNERCIELVIDHYYELVLALIDGSTLITSTLDGKRRREVMLTHHPHSVDQT
jgi:hypothetical protein